MGYLGDLLLPKHAIRALTKMAGAGLPDKEPEGKLPGTREVLSGFAEDATKASKAIGDRLWADKAWAGRRFLGTDFNLGGAVVLGAWLLLVLGLMCIGWWRLIAGFKNHVMPVPALVLPSGNSAPKGPPTPGAGLEGRHDGR